MDDKKISQLFQDSIGQTNTQNFFTCRGRGSFDSQQGDQDNQADIIILGEP